MAETKSTTLTVRVHPSVKVGLRAVAEQERRSLANMIEVMILDYCERGGIVISDTSPENSKA
jgi:hypothetical protein